MAFDKDDIKKQMRASAFCRNNGCVMRTINILRSSYTKLLDVQRVMDGEGINCADFIDCINYLHMANYIQMRNVRTHDACNDFADVDWQEQEAKITAAGVRLMGGAIHDGMVEV